MSIPWLMWRMLAETAEKIIPERESITTMVRSGWAFVRIVLLKPSERDHSQQEIANQLTAAVRKKTKARASGDAAIYFWRPACRYANTICYSGTEY